MKIINAEMLVKFEENYPETKDSIESWRLDVSKLLWRDPTDVKQYRANASILKNNRVVFNILGNRFRLVARIDYSRGVVQIRFIDTHKNYDKINAETI